MEFVYKTEVPSHKKVTYCSFVCDLCPHKKEKYRVRLVVGGNKLICDFETGGPVASMVHTKILCNIIILDAHKEAKP